MLNAGEMDHARTLPEEDDDEEPPPGFATTTREERLAEILASLARSKADAEAGRTFDADEVLAEMRAKVDAYRASQRNGPADR